MNNREIINIFYDEASELREKDLFWEAAGIEAVGSMVNNLFHGRAISDWLPAVYNSMNEAKSLPSHNTEEVAGYEMGIEYLRMLAEDYNVPLDEK